MGVAASTFIIVHATLFFPPLGVFLVAGCGCTLFVNILLTLLGFFPGHIHAFYIIYHKLKSEEQPYGGSQYVENRPYYYGPPRGQNLPPPPAYYYQPAQGQNIHPSTMYYGATGRR